MASTTVMRTDPGFHQDPSKNQSLIGAEYIKHLRFGSVGYSVVAHLAAAQRLVPCPPANDQATRRAVNQRVRNRRDRTFLLVAIASDAMLLVSHDFVDFQVPKRTEIRKTFGVDIMEADVAETMV